MAHTHPKNTQVPPPPGVTGGYKWLQEVRVGYINQLGNYASHTEQKLISFEKSKQEFAVYY